MYQKCAEQDAGDLVSGAAKNTKSNYMATAAGTRRLKIFTICQARVSNASAGQNRDGNAESRAAQL